MKQWWLYFKKYALKFGGIGVLNTLTQQLLYQGLVGMQWDYRVAQGFSFLVALTLSYVLNTTWNYQVKPTFQRAWRFALANLPSFIVQGISLWIWVQWIRVPEQLALLLTLIITVPLSFLCITKSLLKK